MAVALALLPCLLFADALLGRAVFYERDIFAYWVPAIDGFVRAIAEGAWPVWDPLTNFGRPMLADPNFQFAYPPTWLNLVLSPGTYYALFVAGHCAWAGVGAMRLGRAWRLGLPGAAWAGALFMLSGPFLSLVSLFHHYASAAWMGWVLAALERVLERPSPRSTGWLAVAAAAMALAGSADVCLMTGAAALVRALFAFVRGEERGLLGRRIAALAAAAAVGALIAGVQWLPTLAYVGVGSRGAAGAAANMYWSAHPANLLDAAFPMLVSEMPIGAAWRAALFEGRAPLLRSLYVGFPALTLALLGLAGSWRLRWLALGLAAAFLVAGLGRFTPVYPALADLPLLRLVRFPVKMLVPATLFVALLSGAGLDLVAAREWTRGQRRWLIACGIGLGLVAAVTLGAAAAAPMLATSMGPHLAGDAIGVAERLRGDLGRTGILSGAIACVLALRATRLPDRAAPVAVALVLAVAVLDLMAAARDTVRLGPPALLRHRPAVLAAFPDAERHRLYAVEYGIGWRNEHFAGAPPGWAREWAWTLGFVESLAPPIGTRWNLAGSFDGDFTGLTPVALSRLIAEVYYARTQPEGLRLLRMASVTDAVAFEESLFGNPPRAEVPSVYTQPVRVFGVPDPLPRAYVVSGVRRDGPAEAPSIVMSASFDEAREVALDSASGRAPAPPTDDAGRAQIVARRADRLTVAVAAARPAVLVVTEGYDAGWRAWVDGEPAPVWRANAIFRAVPVPAGDHRVEMRYRPPSVAWGAAAAVLGAALSAVLIGRRNS